MPIPQLLNDILSLLFLLAPSAALLSLMLAGIALCREGGASFAIGGSFTKWMFWAVVFLTLEPLLGWFPSFGVGVPMPGGGISTGWLANFQSDIAVFATNFMVGRLVPTCAAYFVLRAILDTASGGHPLPSILAAMFLLGSETTYNLIRSYNTGTPYAPVDVLDSLWNHLVGTIMPVAAVLALVAAILNFSVRKPFMKQVAVSLALLSVSAIWNLVLAMM
jgi:CRISPR-associated Cas5-like protein